MIRRGSAIIVVEVGKPVNERLCFFSFFRRQGLGDGADADPVSLRHPASFAIMMDTFGKPSTSSILLC